MTSTRNKSVTSVVVCDHNSCACTVQLCDVTCSAAGSAFTPVMFNGVMSELTALISESDLHLSQLTLHLLTSVSRVSKQSMTSVHEGILPQLLVLIRSPLLQGACECAHAYWRLHECMILFHITKLKKCVNSTCWCTHVITVCRCVSGAALRAMLEFFQALVVSGVPGTSFNDLLKV